MTPEGLVFRDADEAVLGRIAELSRLGTVPGASPSTEDPHDPTSYLAARSEIARTGGGTVLVAEQAGEWWVSAG